MPGPLAGFTVVEATQMVSGPLAAMLLADQGAEVIKLEQPVGGDRMRYLGHRRGGIGAFWASCNRGKRSLVLDLAQAEGVALAKRLVERSDVFLQNFRPGVTARLGIDEPSLRAVNPDLVYVSISGFGDSGPYVDEKSYDYVIQALSGMASLQTDPATGEPSLVRNIVIDKATAYTVAQAVTAALLARERGAGGQHVRIAMIDVALAFLWPDGMMQHTLLGEGIHEAPHMADGYLVRPTRDGHIAVMAISDRQFPGMCRALGTPWLDDPRFATMVDRERNLAALNEVVTAEFARYQGEELLARLKAEDVPCAILQRVGEVHTDPQVVHNQSLVEHERPWIGTIREPKPAPRFGATPASIGRHAPKLDEHTDEVLTELGCSPEDIAGFRAKGVAGARRPG
jgi:crotonobetainyl-CoA:carnitine CoA-transferase CaiB-like acyl-CoA transferase